MGGDRQRCPDKSSKLFLLSTPIPVSYTPASIHHHAAMTKICWPKQHTCVDPALCRAWCVRVAADAVATLQQHARHHARACDVAAHLGVLGLHREGGRAGQSNTLCTLRGRHGAWLTKAVQLEGSGQVRTPLERAAVERQGCPAPHLEVRKIIHADHTDRRRAADGLDHSREANNVCRLQHAKKPGTSRIEMLHPLYTQSEARTVAAPNV